ncbi:MAG: SAM-dependent chlorinase/fluorinase [Bellilinea sp.]|jgi:S-adenosylmethionine hydrolase
MTVISILTDFGERDAFVGVMKGVIWNISPEVQIADLTHGIEPQNIQHGAWILGQTYRYFPAGSIHIAVVDPGVGTKRRAIAARIGEHIFVAPDNGLLTLPLEQAEANHWAVEVAELDKKNFWLPEVSRTFHGRDIFAPCAAHLANGVPLAEIGSLTSIPPVRITINKPVIMPNTIEAQVQMVDVFGNIITNLSADLLAGMEITAVQLGGWQIEGLSQTFGDSPPGSIIAMFDSSGYLSICVVNGNARQHISARVGDRVVVKFKFLDESGISGASVLV